MHNQKKAYGPSLNVWSLAYVILPTQFQSLSFHQIPSIQPMLLFMLLMRVIMPNANVEVTPVYFCIYFKLHIATFHMRLLQKCLQVTKVLQYEDLIYHVMSDFGIVLVTPIITQTYERRGLVSSHQLKM